MEATADVAEKRGYPWGCSYINGCRPAGALRLSEQKGRTDRGRSSHTEVHVSWMSFKENDLFHHFCMLSPFCGISETARNKTVSLSGLMSLPAEICVWREAFIRALHHPHAVYQPLNLTLTISSVCVYIMCVFVLKWAWRPWTFPLRAWFH